MVVENNAIRMWEIQQRMIENPALLHNRVTIAHIKKHHLRMKQIYRVPFEKNSQRVKDKTRIMKLDASPIPQELIFIDSFSKD